MLAAESFDEIVDKYMKGSLRNYMSLDELDNLFKAITTEFPDKVKRIQIGSTYEQRPINAYLLS